MPPLSPEHSRALVSANDRERVLAMLKKANNPFTWGAAVAAVPLMILLTMSWTNEAALVQEYRWTKMIDEATIVDAQARLGVCDYTGHCDNVLVTTLGNKALTETDQEGTPGKKPQPARKRAQPTSWAGVIGHIAQLVWGAVANTGEIFLGHQQSTTPPTLR